MQTSSPALYRVAQIREAEHIAIHNLRMPGLQLMRSAGAAAFNALRQRWPGQTEITLFCGAGNNAGDGYVLANLALAAGFRLSVYTLIDPGQLKGDALTVYREFIQAGGRVARFAGRADSAGVIVDALLGTGLSRPVGEEYAQAISHINNTGCPVLSIDVPSGLHADTGCVLGCAVKADLTVTFIALKCGLFTGDAADYRGDIVCSSLNVPETVLAQLPRTAMLASKIPLKRRRRNAHKGNFGHVLAVGGNRGFSGAIRMAGEAALFSGAGLVSLASRAQHVDWLNIGRPELMCHAVETAGDLQPWLERADVILIGPGLGQDSWAQDMLRQILASDKPCVADADALNLLARQPTRRPNWILTPHPGEAARLLGCKTHDIGADRFAAVKMLQNRYAGVCVLKGAGSLIADAGNIMVNTTGNPGMAAGGMGDVLVGVMAALLAQGLSLTDAATLAVHVHGEAADLIAASQGERGMLASELLPKIRGLLNP
ncbi:NAD(P)H-hydrate dehydratase [Methylomonas sp. SURF-2]|uniref:Bifunctional NAD(P)H-hydrate repair enzyme n=1 Tax=Methylomonas subterranea TaxID=2952225 RepID=A0ABT1TIF8_9GAMM|nr:NAD(P)H-hydrate dehydratase [Methylomonas sp. SURF-2]MCQ8104554.1 NAD(P)H-hydrate dehydratase [Methylomonas sp. SURF-2]